MRLFHLPIVTLPILLYLLSSPVAIFAAVPPSSTGMTSQPSPTTPAHCACSCCQHTPTLQLTCQPPVNIPLSPSHACDVVIASSSDPGSCGDALCTKHVNCTKPSFLTHQCVSDRGIIRDLAPIVFATLVLLAFAVAFISHLSKRTPQVLVTRGDEDDAERRRQREMSSDQKGVDAAGLPLLPSRTNRSNIGDESKGEGEEKMTDGRRVCHTPRRINGKDDDALNMMTTLPKKRLATTPTTPLLAGEIAELYDSDMFVDVSPRRSASWGVGVPVPPRLQIPLPPARRAVLSTRAEDMVSTGLTPHPDISPLGGNLSREELRVLHPTCMPSAYS